MIRHLDAKKEQLLKAVVKEYLHTASPVASLMLGGHYGLEASSATIRNWMSEMEHLGLLKQPHASSGRIPTDMGYRHYVDVLMEKENLTPKEKRLIRRELESGFREIEDLLRQAAEIVSTLGKCTALILPPLPQEFVLKSLQLVPVEDGKVLLVVLSQTGSVLDRVIDMGTSRERLHALSQILNERLSGTPLSKIGPHLLDGIGDEMAADLYAKIVTLIFDAVAEQNRNKVVVEGMHHFLDQPEFRDLAKFRNTLDVLKNENRLSKFLGRIGRRNGGEPAMSIYIGYENPLKSLQEFSVIAAPYGAGSAWSGALAVVGPTRMDYDHLVPLIEYAASIISTRLQKLIA